MCVNDLNRALNDSYCIILPMILICVIEHKKHATMIDRLNNDLYNIAQWLKSDKLNLNIKEIYYVLFHRSRIKLYIL